MDRTENAASSSSSSSSKPTNPERQEGKSEDDESKKTSISNPVHLDSESQKSVKLKDVKEDIRLQKQLGLLEGVTMIVGIVIGSGIFISPKGVIQYTGSVGMSLAVWVASGLIAMVGAFCFAELGTMIPESGGMYSYLHEAFGPVPAFLCIWVSVIIRNAASSVIVALTFANYLLQPFFECQGVPDVVPILIATALICILSFLNCVNVKWVASVQNVFTFTKVFALVVIIVTGIFHLFYGNFKNYQDPMAGTIWSSTAIATAFYQSLFSYSGWDSLYFVVEELKNPNRNIPLSILISMILVTVVYTLANIAYLAVLTPLEMLSSDAVAMSFANKTLGVMAWVMPIFVMCSTFGAMNGVVLTNSRLLLVGARKGHFPEAFSLLHVKYMTPITSIILNVVLNLLMFFTSDLGVLINYATIAVTITKFACMCALFWFRYKQPDRERPVKVWLILPIIYTITLIFLIVMPMIERPVEVGIGIGVLFSGLPVYYFTIYRKDIAGKFSGILSKMTYVSQLLFLGLPEDKEA